MTPEQAFNIVSQMAAQAHATAADHQMCSQALLILKGIVESQGSQTPGQATLREASNEQPG